MLELRDVSVRDLRSFITERGFSHAGLLERHELEARAEEAAAAQASQPPPAAAGATASPRRSLCDAKRAPQPQDDSEDDDVGDRVRTAERIVLQEVKQVLKLHASDEEITMRDVLRMPLHVPQRSAARSWPIS
jgi:hypothetical protein